MVKINKALLIIDVQTGNFSEQNPIYKGDELLRKIKSLINKARRTAIQVVFVQNNGDKGDPDEYGTTGWKIHPSIFPVEGDMIIQKRSPDAFHKTVLQNELQKRKVNKLYVTGLQTEYCIDTTCRRAYSLGYDVVLVEDAHSTLASSILTAEQIIQHHNTVIGGCFATVKKENQIEF